MRGGKRTGAGRKKHTPNKANSARELSAQSSGETPAEIMLGAMREFSRLAKESTNARKRSEYLRAATAIARDAAPYFHARRIPTASPISIDLPPIVVASDAVAAIGKISAAVGKGDISPTQAMELSAVVREAREAIELLNIETEFRQIEKQVFKT